MDFMQEAMNPDRLAEEMAFINHQLERLHQAHNPGQASAPEDSAKKFLTRNVGNFQLVGEAGRSLFQNISGNRDFMKDADCLLADAEKHGKCLAKDLSVSEHVKWVEEFCDSKRCQRVLTEATAGEVKRKCQNLEPTAAVEEICGKIQTARKDFVEDVTWFQLCYSVFNFIAVFFACLDTHSELRKFEIHCRGYDEQLDEIEVLLSKEEHKLEEMAIKLNESRTFTTTDYYNLLVNLIGIRQKLELLKQDLDHNKRDIKRRKKEHLSGVAAGCANVARAFFDYGLATRVGAATWMALAAGALNTITTFAHGSSALWCQKDLDMIEERLVRVKKYEERAKNIVRRVESLTQQWRMINGAPAAQANILARAIPSSVA